MKSEEPVRNFRPYTKSEHVVRRLRNVVSFVVDKCIGRLCTLTSCERNYHVVVPNKIRRRNASRCLYYLKI